MLFSNMLAINAAEPLDLAPLIYGFVFLVAVISAFIGFWRGFMRQTVRTITIIISAIFSYALVYFIFAGIVKYVDGKTTEELRLALVESGLISEGAHGWISSLDAHTLKLLLSVPISLFALPVIYVLCFIFVSGLTLPLHKLISALCGFKARRSTAATRLLGFLLGAVQGAFVAGIILMPVVGVSSLARESMAAINENAGEESFTATANDTYKAYAHSVSENPVTVAYGLFGIESLYEKVATVTVDGVEVNMTELFPDLPILVSDSLKFGGCDPKALTAEEELRISGMLTRVEGNPIISDILASVIRSGSYAYENGTVPEIPGEPFETLISSSLEIFHTSSAENISKDLGTLRDIYFTLSRCGALTSFYDGHDAVVRAMTAVDGDGKSAASRIVEIARSNERVTPLLTALTRLSVTAMQNGTGITDAAALAYEGLKTGINTRVLTIDKAAYENGEEYLSALSGALDLTMRENGIELKSEIIDGMAGFIADNFSETKELTDSAACEIIFSYYDAYRASQDK